MKDFADVTVAVIGDLMLDIYTYGQASRISPEAPVPILQHEMTIQTLGGAGNVVRNVRALGAGCHPYGAVGADHTGKLVVDLLDNEVGDVGAVGIVRNALTTTKHRLVARDQQLLRVDMERLPLAANPKRITSHMGALAGIDVMLLSDYAKGMLGSAEFCQTLIARAKSVGIPVVVDSKSGDWRKYEGCTIMTPNFAELQLHYGAPTGEPMDYVTRAAQHMIRGMKICKSVAVTCGSYGIWLQVNADIGMPIHGKKVAVADVTGAGDTVAAAIAVGLGAGMDAVAAAEFANSLAAKVVAQPMTAVPTPEDIEQARTELWMNKQKPAKPSTDSAPTSSPGSTKKKEKSSAS